MSTDSISLEGMKSGYHGDVRITPLTVSAATRVEVPGVGYGSQLKKRKTLTIQNTCTSGVLWVGGDNVGFIPPDTTTCSGILVPASGSVTIQAGRSRFYVFNPAVFAIDIKIMEIA